MRDIAATAGVSTKAVYRIAPSKEDLLWRILGWYSQHVVDARDAVLDADSSPLEKLDATLWLNIHTIDRFQAEMNILASFFQVLPPTSPDLELAAKPEDVVIPFAQQLHRIEELLDEGQRSGELRLADVPLAVLARCVFAVIWTPYNIVQKLGPDGALRFGRDTLVWGAAVAEGSRIGDGAWDLVVGASRRFQAGAPSTDGALSAATDRSRYRYMD